jgi:DNA-binding protein H-NS
MARKKEEPSEPSELSIEELQNQLAQIEADKKALEAALRKQRGAELSSFARAIREQILERGYTLDEVVPLLSKGARKGVSVGRSGSYTQYVDPDDRTNTYSRGPLPVWLKEKMVAAGYDPGDKTHREEFKAAHLELVA